MRQNNPPIKLLSLLQHDKHSHLELDLPDGLLGAIRKLGFPADSDSKESICNKGDLGSIPGLERCLGGGNYNPLQYSCLENPHGQKSLADYSQWGRKSQT